MNPLHIPTNNTGRMMSKRIQAADRTTVTLTYSTLDANALRMMAQRIRLKGTKTASLSLIARRGLSLYLSCLDKLTPDALALEISALEDLVTPVPQPARVSKTKKRPVIDAGLSE